MQKFDSYTGGMSQRLLSRLRYSHGIFAALDQSGGSTPAALAHYGIDASQYRDEEEMFDLIHRMRLRVITSPSFDGDRVLAVILFAKTLGGHVGEQTIPEFLLGRHQIASFLKIDPGLEPSVDGVQLMKPIPNLQNTLAWARSLGVVGTKMRTLIHEGTQGKVEEAVRQQFTLAEEIYSCGLIPIVELEVSTKLPDQVREREERWLLDAMDAALAGSSHDLRVFLKLTIPVVPELYSVLKHNPKVYRILALSGGFSRHEAGIRLSRNPGMIASFSRALLEDLRVDMTDEQWNTAIDASLSEVMKATKSEGNSDTTDALRKEGSHE
jgi:fructose-bisphosphate aldolase class I